MTSRSSQKGKTCLRKGCDKPARTKGLCISHYNTAVQVRKRKEKREGLRDFRYGKGANEPRGHQDDGVPLYSFESTRYREAQLIIKQWLRRFGQGQTLWAMPAWGDGARGLHADMEAELLIDYYSEHHPRNFQPWKKTETPDRKLRPKKPAITGMVLTVCRAAAATIVNGVRWELLKAQEAAPVTVSDDLMAYVDQALEDWG